MIATVFIRICPLLITFCSLLLLISLSHRPVDAHGNKQISKKSLSGWIQNYKEPKSSSTESAAHKNEQSASQKAAAAAEEEEEEEEMTCTIKVQKVEKHTGKCVRLRGGSMACQTNTYLDPVNADCMFLEE